MSVSRISEVLRRLALVLFAALVGGAAAVSTAQESSGIEEGRHFEIVEGRSRVSFDMDAALCRFTGTTTAVTGAIALRFDDRGLRARANVVIDARTLDTDDTARDREIREGVLEARRFATITFTADQANQVAFSPSSRSGEFLLLGTLGLHGKARRVAVPVHVYHEGNLLIASGHLSIPDVGEYGVHPPSCFLGLFHASRSVGIRFALVARKAVRSAPESKESKGTRQAARTR